MDWPAGTIQEVWEKGQIVPGKNPAKWRQDRCGAWMARGEYGNRKSSYGWEIGRVSHESNDTLPDLKPLQWENTATMSDARQARSPVLPRNQTTEPEELRDAPPKGKR